MHLPDVLVAPRRRRFRRPGLLTLLLAGIALVLVSAGALVRHHRTADDLRQAETIAGRVAEFELNRLDRALREAPEIRDLDRRLADALPVKARVAMMVLAQDGRKVAQLLRGVATAPQVSAEREPQGQRTDAACACVRHWRPSSDGRYRLVAIVDLQDLLAQVQAQSRHGEVVFAVPLLLLIALPVLLLWPQLRLLSALADRLRSDGPEQAQAFEPLPWWMGREVQTLSSALQQALTSAERERRQETEARELLRIHVEADPDAVFVCDAIGRLQMVNRVAQALAGADEAALVGLSMLHLVAQQDLPALQLLLAAIAADPPGPGVLAPQQIELIDREGQRIPMRLTLAVARLRGAPVLWMHGQDLRPEREAIQRLEQALADARAVNKAKSRFVASVSHEIRTPLNGLAGMLDLLRGSQLQGDQREFADVAHASARQLRSLVNDLLDLAKVEAGRLDLESIPFDVQEQLGNAIRAFDSIAASRGLQLQTQWQTPQRMLLGDPYRICQVLNNLVDNAVKFTAHGTVKVEISTRTVEGDPDHCELIGLVSDTGIGVPPDRLGTLFDHFAQAEQSITRRYGGTGLGLALCRQLCRQMGGDVVHAHRPGGGSIFRFQLRCALAHGMSAFQETQPNEDVVGDMLAGCRVLVADDNRVNQALLRRWLEREQITVEVVGNGELALHAVTEADFDAVLMDVSMPVMNGLDATLAIRALAMGQAQDRARFASLPIIGISAHAMADELGELLACGMNDAVPKPIHRETLLTTLAAAITQRRDALRLVDRPLRLDA